MKIKFLVVSTLVLALNGLAYAGPAQKERTPHMSSVSESVDYLFANHDADGDGKISRDEALAYFEHLQSVRIKD